ncbi:MAG TPA: helix-turn-helix transcriptional regulator [Pseudobdellovibrionaceae bacterium]|nr:helix-turn-helix transcriptional regulator [Pseudobdellovibrionaceae bacterium]
MKKILSPTQDVLQKIGLCQKDEVGRVEIQNQACVNLCGWRIGQVCRDGCMRAGWPAEAVSERKVQVGSNLVEAVCLSTEGKRITILTPLPEREVAMTASSLSLAESAVFRLAERGFSNREIAENLSISMATVKSHVHAIRKKIGADLWSAQVRPRARRLRADAVGG